MGRRSGTAAVRPLLLPLVYVATLSLAGVSCFALAVLGSEHVRASAVQITLDSGQAAVNSFVASNLTTDDLLAGGPSASRRGALETELDELARTHGYDAATLTMPDGRILAGDPLTPDAALERDRAVSGEAASTTLAPSAGPDRILTQAIPISVDGRIRLVAILQRDGAPILAAADAALRDLLVVTVAAAALSAVLLRIIFRADGIRLNVKVRKPTAPLTDRKWVGDESDTGIDWELDTTGDDKPDFVADYYEDSGKITGDVYRASDADKDEPPTLCQLKSATFDPEIGYTAVVDPACVGNPDAVAYSATFYYDTDPSKADGVVAEDVAPDSGLSPRVGRS